MHLSLIGELSNVSRDAWDSLTGGAQPFLRHDFLTGLEQTGCVQPQSGWTPQHLGLFSAADGRGTLLGAIPMYIKHHSYGEFVFDWAWARAYAQAGLSYYPKLVVSVPFTPATGPRILVAPNAPEDTRRILIAGAREHARAINASSVHWLFPNESDLAQIEAQGYIRRSAFQFHWRNASYDNFEDYLAVFSSEKRKKIRQERRYVREAGVTTEVVTGDAITEAHWHALYDFYRATTGKHGAISYLTRDFFLHIGRTMADAAVIVFARHGGRHVAGALNFRGDDTLYGRYWGSVEEFNGLHFETCYYSAIEYCINEGISRFEAGAQGEHKLSRGFLATPVYSAHWLQHPSMQRSVADFLSREQVGVDHYVDELNEHSPFRKECP